MRADRLIALLMLLQTKGRITAAEAAAELEVSERTARRDLEALAMSGVPVYSRHGRGGGWYLVGGAKTDLSGMSVDEARALFLAAGPALESTPELKSAMRKLSSALPETFRAEAQAASTAIKVDPNGWGHVGSTELPRYLDELTEAVVARRQIRIEYEGRHPSRGKRTVHPLGLVTKRNVWYLVGDTDAGLRTFRLSRVRSVEVLDAAAERPDGFDLDHAWEEIVTEVEAKRPGIEVLATVEPSVIGPLRWMFGSQLWVLEQRDDRRFDVRVSANSHQALAAQLASFGGRLELVDPPPELLGELRRIALELHDRYVGADRV